MTRFEFSRTSPTALLFAVLALSSLPACGSKGGDDDDTTGGTGGTGGSGATGGTGATGGSGGSGGSAGTVTTITKKWGFDSDEESWKVQYTSSGKEEDGVTAIPEIPKEDIKVKWVTGKGDGDDGGAIEADIPYESPRQYAGLGISLSGEDLTGKKLTARVKIVSGVVAESELASNTPGAKLYLKTGPDYVYAAGVYQSITQLDTWYTLKMDLGDSTTWSYVDKGTTDAPKVFDPSAVGELGIQFDTADNLKTTVEAGVVLIDNVQY